MDHNIHVLAFEMHKVANGMSEIFELRVYSHCSIRHTSQLVVNPIQSVLVVLSQHGIWKNCEQIASETNTMKSLKGSRKN